MPILKNPRHECFAQELAKGTSASEAYVRAGYKFNDGNAVTLKGKQKVSARVDELQSHVAKRAEITVDSLMAEAAEIQAAALASNQHSAAIAALTAKAKLAGLWVEKSQNTNRNIDADSIPDSELAAAYQAEDRGDIAQASAHPTKLN